MGILVIFLHLAQDNWLYVTAWSINTLNFKHISGTFNFWYLLSVCCMYTRGPARLWFHRITTASKKPVILRCLAAFFMHSFSASPLFDMRQWNVSLYPRKARGSWSLHECFSEQPLFLFFGKKKGIKMLLATCLLNSNQNLVRSDGNNTTNFLFLQVFWGDWGEGPQSPAMWVMQREQMPSGRR